MGTFIAASSAVGVDAERFEAALRELVAARDGVFEPTDASCGENDTAYIRAEGSNVTILYPGDFFEWDEFSSELSKALHAPVFSLHIHDGDLWMFLLFDKGEDVARFNPLPDYWEQIDDTERARWAGDADAVAALVPGLDPATIRNYFRPWDDEITGGERFDTKAYPDDEHEFGVDWQLCDFMKRAGLPYPDVGFPGDKLFRLSIKSGIPELDAQNPPPKPSGKPPPIEPLRLRPSLLKALVFLLGGCGLLAAGWLLPSHGAFHSGFSVWVGLASLAAGIMLLCPGAYYLQADDKGVTLSACFYKVYYHWRDIAGFDAWNSSAQLLVAIVLTEERLRMEPAWKRLFMKPVALPNIYGLKASELACQLNMRLEASRRGAAGSLR